MKKTKLIAALILSSVHYCQLPAFADGGKEDPHPECPWFLDEGETCEAHRAKMAVEEHQRLQARAAAEQKAVASMIYGDFKRRQAANIPEPEQVILVGLGLVFIARKARVRYEK